MSSGSREQSLVDQFAGSPERGYLPGYSLHPGPANQEPLPPSPFLNNQESKSRGRQLASLPLSFTDSVKIFPVKKTNFQILKKDPQSRARAGVFKTSHGLVETPVFMPVGTQATVKSLTPEDLIELGAQIILNNTYHLYLRPGTEVIAKFGGVHKFQHWDGPILTDSGGFQVFSLGRGSAVSESSGDKGNKGDGVLAKIDKDGVDFRSHLDGSKHRFTAEKSIEIQHALNSDIILAFDECAPYPSTEAYSREAMERTHQWAVRSLRRHSELGGDQLLFGIVQGGSYPQLREESAKFINSLDFAGHCIGGVSVGEPKELMYQAIDKVRPWLAETKPVHLLGVGEVEDFFEAIERGVDMFDCVAPTRNARNGGLYISPFAKGYKGKFRINIFNAGYKGDMGAIDSTCGCYSCKNYSRAYLHHLFKAEELLAYRLASIHNLYFCVNLVKSIRQSLLEGTYRSLRSHWLAS